MAEPLEPMDEHRTSVAGRAGALATLALFASSLGLAAVEDEGAAPVPGATARAGSRPLAQLVVAPEADGDDYDRDEFKHWIDADGDGCSTRQEVLILESREEPGLDPARCRVTSGEWFSVYDALVVTRSSSLDIDHMVPLKEAWESTASTWTDEQREEFANDLDTPLALLAVTASTNRSKADRDPAGWKPPDSTFWCTYATAWVGVKTRWSLTADADELVALEEMLATC